MEAETRASAGSFPLIETDTDASSIDASPPSPSAGATRAPLSLSSTEGSASEGADSAEPRSGSSSSSSPTKPGLDMWNDRAPISAAFGGRSVEPSASAGAAPDGGGTPWTAPA